MAQVSRNLFPVHPHSDRWLMQSLVEHSSSDPAREAAAAWPGSPRMTPRWRSICLSRRRTAKRTWPTALPPRERAYP